MKKYAQYVEELDTLLTNVARRGSAQDYSAEVASALDGRPSQELQRLVSRADLRQDGAFFTGKNLAQLALSSFESTLDRRSLILDPACGAGDLLIECARYLPKYDTLADTLHGWGGQIMGYDLHAEFISVAKLRLILTAVRNGSSCEPENIFDAQTLFPCVRVGDGLAHSDKLRTATHVVLNPPFTLVQAPNGCEWAGGRVNAAAVFLEHCLKHAKPGARIVAILPDVLRSGTRYRKWREKIESRSNQVRIQFYGQFDSQVDVDVFILELEVCENAGMRTAGRWNLPEKATLPCIGDYFDVSVGPVVDYRDPESGPIRPFIKPRMLPVWQTISTVDNSRRFEGRVFASPFVVVRRTSRSGDQHRAIGTIVDIAQSVAVENHLVVLKPKDSSVETCKRLLSVLRNPQTTPWLDQTIRCRHLTVTSLAQIPWWSEIE